MMTIRDIPTLGNEQLDTLLSAYSKRLSRALDITKSAKKSGDKTWQRENRQEIATCRAFIAVIKGTQHQRNL